MALTILLADFPIPVDPPVDLAVYEDLRDCLVGTVTIPNDFVENVAKCTRMTATAVRTQVEALERALELENYYLSRPAPRAEPEAIPDGWPPWERRADVVTPDGIRSAGDRKHPYRGTPRPAAMEEYLRQRGCSDWQCCRCGTCNPADPCIPGAYF